MHAFEYQQPVALADAIAAIQAGGQAIAGGQTLIASLKQRLAQPETLVDLAAIPEMQGIKINGDSLWIGAMTRHQTVAGDATVRARLPGLAALAGGIGDRQVRARGTIGGSVANNDPAACYPSALLALDATVHTTARDLPASEFFQGFFTTALEPDELVTGVSFPLPRASAYAKFKQPASRFATVGVFVAQFDRGVRVAITGAGSGVFRHAGLEAALSANFSPEAVDNVVIAPDDLSADIHATPAYRAALIAVQTKRAVTQALA